MKLFDLFRGKEDRETKIISTSGDRLKLEQAHKDASICPVCGTENHDVFGYTMVGNPNIHGVMCKKCGTEYEYYFSSK